jgi:cytochrome P450
MPYVQSAPSLPPGRLGLPVIGETISFALDPNFVEKRQKKYGPIFKTRLLGQQTIVVIGAEANRMVLASDFDRFSWRQGWPDTFKELLGESLFVMDGAEHKHKRKLLMPAFHGRALASYWDTMEQFTLSYLAQWERQGSFTWLPEFQKLTFDIASKLLLGSEPGPETAQLSRWFRTLTNGLVTLPIRLPWTPYGRALKARDKLLAHIETTVRHRQSLPDAEQPMDALGMLMQSRDENGHGLSLAELKVQSLLLLVAGHETTTASLTMLCYELARNPEVLERARAEQLALAAQGPLTMSQLDQMPYLDLVLREVERLHPAVSGGFRGIMDSFEFNGYHIPRGWQLMYRPPETHQDAQVYTNPERFDPDRFGPERAEHKRQAFSLVGFGGGPRSCIGMAFAQLEMKMIVSYLLRRYSWELLPKQDLQILLLPTRHVKSGLKVRLRPL